jgi:hypothetical protein
VKKIKSSKKEDKQRGKKWPAEAAGATTQTSHNGGGSISSHIYQIQPFRAAGAGAPAPHISKVNDSYHNCWLFGQTGPRNTENPSDLTQQDLPEELLFKEAYADTFKVQPFLWIWKRENKY